MRPPSNSRFTLSTRTSRLQTVLLAAALVVSAAGTGIVAVTGSNGGSGGSAASNPIHDGPSQQETAEPNGSDEERAGAPATTTGEDETGNLATTSDDEGAGSPVTTPGEQTTTDTTNDDTTNDDTTTTGQPQAKLDLPYKITTEDLIAMDASGSTDPDCEIVEYRWDYGGDDAIDETMAGPLLEMQFISPGEVEISVTVVDDDGNTDTATETMTVVQANSTSDSRNPDITL